MQATPLTPATGPGEPFCSFRLEALECLPTHILNGAADAPFFLAFFRSLVQPVSLSATESVHCPWQNDSSGERRRGRSGAPAAPTSPPRRLPHGSRPPPHNRRHIQWSTQLHY